MRIINRGRCTGKTTLLIATSYVMGIPIIVTTEARKKLLLEKAEFMACDVQVFTFNEYAHHRYSGQEVINQVLIDEAKDIIEDALNRHLGCNVAAITMTLPVEGE